MRRNTILLGALDGGCCGSPQLALNNPNPATFPINGALVCDDRYLTLASGPRAQLLGVPAEANCQVFLRGDASGFVVFDLETGEVLVTGNPSFALDIFNPAVAGNTPIPDPFSFILIAGPGDGATPSWHFLRAPTFGSYMIQVVGGRFILADIGAIPGLNDVGVNNQEIGSGRAVVMIETAPGVWALRMLTVAHQRVMVGDITGGVKSYKPLPDDEWLQHPFAKILDILQAQKYEQLTGGGAVETGGILQRVTVGAGAITDAERLTYSPAARKFCREPAKVLEAVANDVDTLVADNGAWNPIDGHLSVTTRFDYPNFYVSAYIRTQMRDGGGAIIPDATADYNMQFGLFIDGVLVHWWPIKGSKDNTLGRLICKTQGVVVGMDHSVVIRVNKPSVVGQNLWILATNMDVFTVVK